jgi:hypothetical protein
MSKQKKESQRLKNHENPNEYYIYDKSVRAQYGPIHKIVTKGTTVEFTNNFQQAQAVFKDVETPKQWYKIAENGAVTCISNVI